MGRHTRIRCRPISIYEDHYGRFNTKTGIAHFIGILRLILFNLDDYMKKALWLLTGTALGFILAATVQTIAELEQKKATTKDKFRDWQFGGLRNGKD